MCEFDALRRPAQSREEQCRATYSGEDGFFRCGGGAHHTGPHGWLIVWSSDDEGAGWEVD
jgi:hypothetical protein